MVSPATKREGNFRGSRLRRTKSKILRCSDNQSRPWRMIRSVPRVYRESRRKSHPKLATRGTFQKNSPQRSISEIHHGDTECTEAARNRRQCLSGRKQAVDQKFLCGMSDDRCPCSLRFFVSPR